METVYEAVDHAITVSLKFEDRPTSILFRDGSHMEYDEDGAYTVHHPMPQETVDIITKATGQKG